MKITGVKVYLIDRAQGVAPPPAAFARRRRIASPWTLVEVSTDEGIVGLGDGTNWPGSTVIKRAAEELSQLVIGESPFDIELLYNLMYRSLDQIGQQGAVIAALSAIEIALWDIVGQATGQPIYNLMGGVCRDRVRYYNHARSPEEAARKVERGATAIKAYFPLPPLPEGERIPTPRSITVEEELQALGYLKAYREALGNAVDLCIDAQARYTTSAAIRLGRRLEEVGLFFYEEPVRPENVDALLEVKRAVNVPICVGERRYTRYGFRDLLAQQAVHMVMPDVVRTGGIMETKKIAAMAEVYYVQVSPHNPNSPASTLASLHVMANLPNANVLEWRGPEYDPPWAEELFTDPPVAEGGYLRLPANPGLGTRLVHKVAERYRYDG
jgi:galactonate dehydratase